MKRVLTAMGNAVLNNELKRYREFDLNDEDLFYQEAVIDEISENEYDVLTVSALLQGQMEFNDFIEKIRNIDRNIRIIVVTDEISVSMKRKLNENEIVDIFLDDEIEVSNIIDAINREEPLRKKIGAIKEEKAKYESNSVQEIKEYKVKTITQKQEVIVFSGINGSGKSTLLVNFAKILARKTPSKILIIDLDTLSGNIDELLAINKIPQNVEITLDENKKCGINYAAELILKNRFDSNVFEELVINAGTIDVLTGNTSLHYCQNVLNEEHYQKILDAAKEKYDFIIMDTSSNIFLDSTKWALQQSNRIFFVTENNYISMRKSEQLLNIMTDTWGVLKDKIQIIVNKEQINGLELDVIKSIFNDYEVVGNVKSNEQTAETSYVRLLETIKYIPKVNIINKLFANKYQGIIMNNIESKNIRKEVYVNAN